MPFSPDILIETLHNAQVTGSLSRTAVELARFAVRMEIRGSAGQGSESGESFPESAPNDVEWVMFSAMLLGLSLEQGHTCLEISEEGLRGCLGEDMDIESIFECFPAVSRAFREGSKGTNLNPWKQLSERLSHAISCSFLVGNAQSDRPFVFSGKRLYLSRYHRYERRLARGLLHRARKTPGFFTKRDAGLELLDRLFPVDKAPSPDWQKIAVANGLEHSLLVISGGPGTGKTRTVAALMAVMQRASEGAVKMALCAPTGKAAARLSESVSKAAVDLGLPGELMESIPMEALTIHRLLGAGRTPGAYRFNRENPLGFQVVIVDEASMVDLPMMVHLVEALKEDASLVLIGDKNQLASVEVGCVLSDICAGVSRFSYSRDFISLAKEIGQDMSGLEKGGGKTHPLKDCIVTLSHNFRFWKGSGIDELSSKVNEGDLQGVLKIVSSDKFPDVRLVTPEEKDIFGFIEDFAGEDVRGLCSMGQTEEALKRLNHMKILCGVRKGRLGVQAVNTFVSRVIAGAGTEGRQGLFKGLPIIINKNDYFIRLFNGDIGLCWPDEKGAMKVLFPEPKHGPRMFSPSRLPAFEPAWAVTVHRSQGSEFEKVLFILPPEDSPLIGRELLYTAITRAKKEIVIYGTMDALEKCVRRPTMRFSGLYELLWDN